MICTISGTEITAISITRTTTQSYIFGRILSGIWLGDNKIFVAHSYQYNSYYMYGAILLPFTTIETTNAASNEILGVAKTSAASGKTVDVYIPDV